MCLDEKTHFKSQVQVMTRLDFDFKIKIKFYLD